MTYTVLNSDFVPHTTGNPKRPRDLFVKSHTSETLLVSWSVPFNGGYDIIGFEIEYKTEKTGATWTRTNLTDCLNENELCEKRLVGLEPETQYRLANLLNPFTSRNCEVD